MADIVSKGSQVLQLSHTSTGFTDSDFDRGQNASSLGEFLSGAGDESTADYIDVYGSLRRAARLVTVTVKVTGACRIKLAFNPYKNFDRTHDRTDPRGYWRPMEPLRLDYGFRNVVTMDFGVAEERTFTYNASAVHGFHIDYDASVGASTVIEHISVIAE